MSVVRNILFIFFILLINNCSLSKLQKFENQINYSIEIDTPNDKFNTYLGEHLKRLFFAKDNLKKNYMLKSHITFQSTDTLSVNGNNKLKSTKAKIEYQLINKNTNEIIKSSSFFTNPALSSSSSSFYTQQKSIEHIKERLVKSSANSLFMRIKVTLRKLS